MKVYQREETILKGHLKTFKSPEVAVHVLRKRVENRLLGDLLGKQAVNIRDVDGDTVVSMEIEVSEWISVDDELPDDFVSVFGTNGHVMGECYRANGEWVWLNPVLYGTSLTKWQYLPKPPKA